MGLFATSLIFICTSRLESEPETLCSNNQMREEGR
jgi:hypothetical protein